VGLLPLVFNLPYSEILSQFLEVAFPTLCADQAIERMIREDQLHDSPTSIEHPDCIGFDNHSILALCSASWSKVSATSHLYHTHSAATRFVFDVEILQMEVTECGNLDPYSLGSFEDSGSRVYLNYLILNGYFYFIHSLIAIKKRILR
jgi:hypothetical protein